MRYACECLHEGEEIKEINIGLLGAGVVGSGTIDLLARRGDQIARSVGARFAIRRILVRDPLRPRPVPIDRSLLTTDAASILDDPSIDIVVELIGGETPAVEYIAGALRRGKHVVTANKEVVAKHGSELLDLANRSNVNLFFEASVGGGIPVIAVLRHDLIANEITSLRAIINGTTNFILTAMEQGHGYEDALREAQRLGYAEADPTNDVDGTDATYKLAILSTLAFRTNVRPSQIEHFGIQRLSQKDFQYAAGMGYVIKLLAAADAGPNGIAASVRPTLIPTTHHLASVKGVFNAVLIDGDQVDKFMLYGRGAGARPTASAVVADLCAVAHNLQRNVIDRVDIVQHRLPVVDFGDTQSRFYIRLQVADRPGVLAAIARVLGDNEISIASVMQHETDETAGVAEIVIMTHLAAERRMATALTEIGTLDVVRETSAFIRVER